MVAYIMDGAFSLCYVLIISTPVWIFVNLLWMILRGQNGIVQRCLFIKEYVFFTYILLLAEVTGFFDWGVNKLFGAAFNFMPFTDMDSSQVILNVILFVPLGISTISGWVKISGQV